MIAANVRYLFSMIEEGFCGNTGGVARAGECVYMSYTETANRHNADLNNVSPNRVGGHRGVM